MTKILKKYLALIFIGTLLQFDTIASMNKDDLEINETTEFVRLVKKVLKSQKPTVNERAGLGILREVVKIGGCISLIMFESKAANYEIRPTSNPGQSISNFLSWAFSSKEDLEKKIYAAFAISVLAMLFPLICDTYIYKSDQTLCTLKNLEKYVASLPQNQKRKIADLLKNKHHIALITNKILQEGDSGGVKFARLLTCLFDILLPMLPLLYFCHQNGWDLTTIGTEFNKKADWNLLTLKWNNNLVDLLKSPLVLILSTMLATFNLPLALSNLNNSPASKKIEVWKRILKKLKVTT